MSKKLEELFNLPPREGPEPEESMSFDGQKTELSNAENIIDRINQALPQVNELDSADNELDELADLAKEKFEDLMNLGMNVEARYSGTILQTAGVLLGHAITAKQAKIDKKLRMVDLQLKKMRLDQNALNTDSLPPVEGKAIVLDRNEMLRQILQENKDKKNLN